jgi:hypothetical protein
MENNALGYSGTNSGGTIVIENSQFDGNQDGLDTNTAVIGDPPAPQDGRCPNGGVSPITRTISCWVLIHNYIHDNNSATVPAAGSAAAGPIGTGLTISGGRYDTVMDNTIVNNGAWGALFVPYAQKGTPSLHQTCTGSGGHQVPGFGCVLDPQGDALLHNTFRHNGYFGNPSNSDFGQITLFGGEPANCFAGNHAPDGSAPPNLEKTQPTCGGTTTAGNNGGALFPQVLCDAGLAPCPAGAKYPKPNGTVIMKPLPSGLPTMPNPCAGVPANPWCPAHHGGDYVQPAAATGSLTLIAVPAAGWRLRRRPRMSLSAPAARGWPGQACQTARTDGASAAAWAGQLGLAGRTGRAGAGGRPRPGRTALAAHQAERHWGLADIKMRIEACRYLTWKACHDFERTGGRAEELAIMTKVYCSEAAVEAVYDCMRVVGIASYTKDLAPLEKIMRDAMVFPPLRRRQPGRAPPAAARHLPPSGL